MKITPSRKEMVGITLDKETKSLLDNYAKRHGLSRSALIRFAVHEFLATMKEIHSIRKGNGER